MGAPGRIVTIQPLGSVPPKPLARIAEALSSAFAALSSVAARDELPSNAWMPSRGQYDSARLILFLEKHRPADGGKVLGVCDADLGSPILTFVFGAAQVGGHYAVVSLARLRPEAYGLAPDPDLFLLRAAKEAVHEIAHTAGLKHCFRYDCIMHSAESIEMTDLKRIDFCSDCAARLKEGQWC